jgi:simple sugar transport system substrate-binding protein
MVSFLQTAISAKANGIATTVINATGFTTPVMDAMNAGIPVVTYNADGVYTSNGTPNIGTNRLCYVGQALYLSGQQLGERIKSLVTTPGEIVIFIATPGTGNIQPRFDGAAAVLKAAGYTVSEIATGAATSVELAAEKAYFLGHKGVKGAFAVDAGSTEFLAQALSGSGLSSLPAGGFDLTPVTLSAIQSGAINFTINQNPYLQGFLPTLYLYMYNLSGGLVPPPDTDTGLSFVTKTNVGPYLASSSRFEGSTTAEKVISLPSGAINNPIATTST